MAGKVYLEKLLEIGYLLVFTLVKYQLLLFAAYFSDSLVFPQTEVDICIFTSIFLTFHLVVVWILTLRCVKLMKKLINFSVNWCSV